MKKILILSICVLIPALLIIFVPNISFFFKTREELVVTKKTISAGDSLYNCLKNEGISDTDVNAFSEALKNICKLDKYRVGDTYEIISNKQGEFRTFKYYSHDGMFVHIITKDKNSGAISVSSQKILDKEKVVGVSGTITSSLWDAMIGNGLSPALIMDFTDVFAWQIDFLTEPRSGDTYKLVWLRHYNDKGQFKDEKIFAAQYIGKEAGTYTAVMFDGKFYDLHGKSLQKQFLRAPLNYRRISSYFTNKRFHPILKYYRPHHGIDYAAPTGTPIVSIGDGSVILQGWKGQAGKTVRIKHNSIYTTQYGHLSGYAKGIKKGVKVKQGQLIGFVGMTGLATGPHLDFRIEKNSTPVNFLKIIIPPGSSVSKKDIEAFTQLKKEFLTKLAGTRLNIIE